MVLMRVLNSTVGPRAIPGRELEVPAGTHHHYPIQSARNVLCWTLLTAFVRFPLSETREEGQQCGDLAIE